jgi:S-adenosylmethionine:tRNA ribosyltransferase-isomerase
MLKQDFQFDLPSHLIASHPCKNRTDSRLLVVNPLKNRLLHQGFMDFIDYLQPNDCLIFNNTKVIPARLTGIRSTGGKVEIFIERIEDQQTCLAQIKSSNALHEQSIIVIKPSNGQASIEITVLKREGLFYRLKVAMQYDLTHILNEYGNIPLPPYIHRKPDHDDKIRYQTVYAKEQGAVAAPTAGLHFNDNFFERIKNKGIAFDFVTLHVGAGTFSPMRVNDIRRHKMHSESFNVPQSVVDLVNVTKKKKGRVIAIGTTSVRCLESAYSLEHLKATQGETDIFIYPGYSFRVVDALFTNFHLSESTLLMLVSAFAGQETIQKAYRAAINEKYRFFSYGDAMFIENKRIH